MLHFKRSRFISTVKYLAPIKKMQYHKHFSLRALISASVIDHKFKASCALGFFEAIFSKKTHMWTEGPIREHLKKQFTGSLILRKFAPGKIIQSGQRIDQLKRDTIAP